MSLPHFFRPFLLRSNPRVCKQAAQSPAKSHKKGTRKTFPNWEERERERGLRRGPDCLDILPAHAFLPSDHGSAFFPFRFLSRSLVSPTDVAGDARISISSRANSLRSRGARSSGRRARKRRALAKAHCTKAPPFGSRPPWGLGAGKGFRDSGPIVARPSALCRPVRRLCEKGVGSRGRGGCAGREKLEEKKRGENVLDISASCEDAGLHASEQGLARGRPLLCLSRA